MGRPTTNGKRADGVTLSSVLFGTVSAVDGHDTGVGHPERSERLQSVADGIGAAGVHDVVTEFNGRRASFDELALVHDEQYLDALARFMHAGGGDLDPDTPTVEASWSTALYAVGTGLVAIESLRRGEGRAALGTGLKEFASRGVPWIIEASGFDYCMIDHEHGAFDLETIADLAGWFQATDVSAIVRIHKSFTYLIPAILDQGIMGVQVSEVDSVEEARAIVRQAKYPPIGERGISGQGMHTGYRSHGARHATEYAPWANANIITCVSIESLEGLENVEAIAAVEGIDMIAYGHSDLSARLGVHLQLEHPTFKAAVRRIAEACNAHGKLARGSAETEAQIEEYWRLGCKVLNLPGNDISTYLDGLKARAGRARERLKAIGVPV